MLDADGKVANKTAKNKPDFKNINSYAVNGVFIMQMHFCIIQAILI